MSVRPPVVTILGHVDHGKTTLLDFVRKSRIAAKEFGGITQRIGAYEIKTGIKGYKNDRITFVDTPGHETFAQLRARGANVADIALLLIDAKDSLMPQTVESISHIKAAKIPFVVVLNKTDLPEANPEKVKTDLLKHQVMVEGKGGTVPVVNISAKTGQGVNDLLETILLLSSDLNLTFDENKAPLAYVIETKKDKRGIVASLIIKEGQIKVGDSVYALNVKGKVKSLINDMGKPMRAVIPSSPFELLGFESLPMVGAKVTDQATNSPDNTKSVKTKKVFDLDSIIKPVEEEKKLSLIIKTDSFGSLEATTHSLANNKNLNINLSAVGDINKSDVFLAKTTKSVIVGFNAKADLTVKDLAKQEKVIIKSYNIIYELLEELNEVADLIKEKEEKEKSLKGEAKIQAGFIIEGEKVLGIKVTKGKINLGDMLEIYRQNNPIGKSKLVSLKIRAKRVTEVKKDQEAGMIVSPQLDIRTGDVVKSIL